MTTLLPSALFLGIILASDHTMQSDPDSLEASYQAAVDLEVRYLTERSPQWHMQADLRDLRLKARAALMALRAAEIVPPATLATAAVTAYALAAHAAATA